jgi:UDP-glucose 4-epimerase
MKRILVTGGAGFIGSHLVVELVKLGNSVTVIDDLSNGRMENLSGVEERIIFVKDDISKPFELRFEDYDIIYHLACYPRSLSFDNPRRDVEVNVIGTLNVLELAKRNGAKIIFPSNSGIYDTSKMPIDETSPDNPKTPYDLDKLQAENYLKLYKETYGTKYVIFRLATVYGPRQRTSLMWKPVVMEFITKLMLGKAPTIYGDGKQTRDFIHVRDVVKALILAMYSDRAEGETMVLGTGRETSINELYGLISKLMNVSIPPNYAPERVGEIRRMRYDSRKAQNLLGWKAEVSLEEGVAEVVRVVNR